MRVWRRRKQRSGRWPGRLRRLLLQYRYSAAEGVLGATALVLIIWLLWPPDSGPQLDRRVAWEESLKDSQTRDGEPSPVEASTSDPRLDRLRASTGRDIAESDAAESSEPRLSLSKPSELADRLPRDDSWVAVFPEPESVPGVPVDIGQERSVRVDPSETSDSDGVRAALDQVIAELRSGDAGSESPVPNEEEVDVVVRSTESLDAEQVSTTGLDAPDPLDAPDEFDFETDPSADIELRPLDEAPSWLNNAVTVSLAEDRPVIAMVIDDLGLNRPNTAALNDLPGPLTLSFLPYAGRLGAQVKAARDAGHEILLHLPMEPVGKDSPGPDALITSINRAEFVARLEKNLNRFQGFVGVNNHMGSRITADRGRMEVVMRELRDRDVLFLDSKTSANSVGTDVANRNGVPNTSRDVFIDHVIERDAINKQLALVERIARQTGSVVAIGHPHSLTIEALRSWLPSLEERGFALAPVSAVVVRRACNNGILITPAACGRYLQAKKPDENHATLAEGG